MAASPKLGFRSLGSDTCMIMAALGGGLVCLLTSRAEKKGFGKPRYCITKGPVLSKSFCGLDLCFPPSQEQFHCVHVALLSV